MKKKQRQQHVRVIKDRLKELPDPVVEAMAVLLTPSRMAASLGRKGGQSTSDRKTKAARQNGKLGGRPKKGSK